MVQHHMPCSALQRHVHVCLYALHNVVTECTYSVDRQEQNSCSGLPIWKQSFDLVIHSGDASRAVSMLRAVLRL